MGTEGRSEAISQILAAAGEGRPVDMEALLPLVYERLRAIAARQMEGERKGHTLQPTALVHEAYLRLAGLEDLAWASKAHFFGAAAAAMRRILIDHARSKNAAKRGGSKTGFPLSAVDLADRGDFAETVAVDEAVSRLSERDGALAEVVLLRFYAGLPNGEVAMLLGRSERTVRRQWWLARAWLESELGE